MPSSKSDLVVYLIATFDQPTISNGNFAHVSVVPFRYEWHNGNKEIRYFVAGYHDYPLELCGLRARCQIDGRTRDVTSYAWTVGYAERACDLTLLELEPMCKTLKTIERRLAKMVDVEGQPRDFAHFVNRFARAIGANGLIERTEHQHYVHTLGQIPNAIARIEADLFEQAASKSAA